jgi:hypothetical protein
LVVSTKFIASPMQRQASGQGQRAALVYHSKCLPKWGTFFFGQSDNLSGSRSYPGVIAAGGVWYLTLG